jgi:hypothetical protein
MNIRIEKGVPMPPPSRSKTFYPWREMKVGDSFFAVGREMNGISSSASSWGKKLNCIFRCRQNAVGGEEGIRVWRVK